MPWLKNLNHIDSDILRLFGGGWIWCHVHVISDPPKETPPKKTTGSLRAKPLIWFYMMKVFIRAQMNCWWLGDTLNDGKSPFIRGKSTISVAMFNSFSYAYQRVCFGYDCWAIFGNPYFTSINSGILGFCLLYGLQMCYIIYIGHERFIETVFRKISAAMKCVTQDRGVEWPSNGVSWQVSKPSDSGLRRFVDDNLWNLLQFAIKHCHRNSWFTF